MSTGISHHHPHLPVRNCIRVTPVFLTCSWVDTTADCTTAPDGQRKGGIQSTREKPRDKANLSLSLPSNLQHESFLTPSWRNMRDILDSTHRIVVLILQGTFNMGLMTR